MDTVLLQTAQRPKYIRFIKLRFSETYHCVDHDIAPFTTLTYCVCFFCTNTLVDRLPWLPYIIHSVLLDVLEDTVDEEMLLLSEHPDIDIRGKVSCTPTIHEYSSLGNFLVVLRQVVMWQVSFPADNKRRGRELMKASKVEMFAPSTCAQLGF